MSMCSAPRHRVTLKIFPRPLFQMMSALNKKLSQTSVLCLNVKDILF